MNKDKRKKDKPKIMFLFTLVLLITLFLSQASLPRQELIAATIPASKTLNKNSVTIFVDKSEQFLTIMLDGQPIKTYHAEFGDSGMGDKKISGDHKTPEGTFYVCEKSVLSPADEYLGSRWMRLSYPNIEDGRRGLKTGLINETTYNEIVSAINQKKTPPQRTALGGGIGIHGGSKPDFGDNWTWGCVGLSNKDAEEIYDYVSIGTPVIIQR
jgi:lipoprotein-anchoring transpeptidase ErfK/SrfK